MLLYLINTNLEVIEFIEVYSSLIWTEGYYDVGDFELYLPATKETMDLYAEAVKNHWMIVRADDPLSDMRGMIITSVKDDLQFDKAKNIIITGKSFKGLLNNRIVWGKKNLSGPIETQLRELVTENCISPATVDRVIPYLQLGEEANLTDIINIQLEGNFIDDVVKTVCQLNKIGWDIRLDFEKKKFNFILYKGIDRSYSQEAPLSSRNPYVVFSMDFDNLLKTSYTTNMDNFRNIALVGAEYEEYDEKKDETKTEDYSQIVIPKNTDKRASGFDRFELYVDGSSLQSSASENINALGYLLQTKGRTELEKYKGKIEISGEVVPNLTYTINEDYFLGDLVTIINEYGQQYDARVTKVTETRTVTKDSCIPSFTIENYTGKEKEKDKSIHEDQIRIVENQNGDYRISENGEIRLIEKGYFYTSRMTEDGIERDTENGRERSATYDPDDE
mgnify:CR=1 FL=1